MRHLCNIRNNRIACQVLADSKRETALCAAEFLGLQNIPQSDKRRMLVGHFDTDGRFAGNRRLDPDIHRCKTEFDIICQIDDP